MKQEGEIYVGPAGWSYEDWKGIVYPPDMPRALHPLTFLSGLFDMLEVNATFYRTMPPTYAEGWVRRVSENPRFMFTAKLWQRFTHEHGAAIEPADVRAYTEGIQPLREAGRLGAILIQFPWSFRRTPANRQWLARLLDTFAAFPLSVEFRHAEWDRPEVMDGLRDRGVAFCNIDEPVLHDCLAPTDYVTAPFAYVRFHGRNAADWFGKDTNRNRRYNYLYSEGELMPWLERIAAMRKRARSIFVVTNNHFEGQAVANALELQQKLTGRYVPPPSTLAARYPRLAKPS